MPPPPYGDAQQPPQPYPVAPGGPVPPAYRKPVPSRRRPSGWWFAVAIGLMLAGVAVGVLLVVQSVRAFVDVDATVRADGEVHAITVPTDRDRMIWAHPGQPPACMLSDTATGEVIDLGGLGATYTKSGGSGSWEGTSRFDPGSGDLEVTCAPFGSDIQIAPAPDFGSVFGGLAAGILLALLLGGGGFVLLVVLVILFATGRPRNVPAPH